MIRPPQTLRAALACAIDRGAPHLIKQKGSRWRYDINGVQWIISLDRDPEWPPQQGRIWVGVAVPSARSFVKDLKPLHASPGDYACNLRLLAGVRGNPWTLGFRLGTKHSFLDKIGRAPKLQELSPDDATDCLEDLLQTVALPWLDGFQSPMDLVRYFTTHQDEFERFELGYTSGHLEAAILWLDGQKMGTLALLNECIERGRKDAYARKIMTAARDELIGRLTATDSR